VSIKYLWLVSIKNGDELSTDSLKGLTNRNVGKIQYKDEYEASKKILQSL